MVGMGVNAYIGTISFIIDRQRQQIDDIVYSQRVGDNGQAITRIGGVIQGYIVDGDRESGDGVRDDIELWAIAIYTLMGCIVRLSIRRG